MTRPSTPPPSPGSGPPSASPTTGVDAAELNPGRTARRRRIWPWLIIVPLVVVALSVLTFNWRSAARLQAALDDLAARGEPLTYAEAYALIAADPPADDDNLAGVPLLLSMHNSEPGRAMRRQLEENQPELLEQWEQLETYWGRTTATKAGSIERTSEDFDAWHPDSANAYYGDPEDDWEWIEHDDGPAASIYLMSEFLHPLIHQLAADCRHRSRALWSQADINEDDLYSVMLDMLGPDPNSLVGRVQALRAIALAALEREDPELAAASLELNMALARAQGKGVAMIGVLVTNVMVGLADGPLYAGLSRHAWNDPQLARLQQAIEHTLDALDPQSSLRFERVVGLSGVRQIKNTRTTDGPLFQLEGWERLLFRLLPAGTYDQLAVRLIEDYDHDWLQPGALLPQEVDRPQSNLPEWLGSVEVFEVLDLLESLVITADLTHRMVARARAAETRLRLAHAAIALERFHLQHERYPDDWQELIPGILDQPPLDPFTRGELVLLPADPAAGRERPVIYSLGLNREDNGGTQAFSPGDPSGLGDQFATGDAVWGYPGDEPPAGPGDD